jgi:hypothetical protein
MVAAGARRSTCLIRGQVLNGYGVTEFKRPTRSFVIASAMEAVLASLGGKTGIRLGWTYIRRTKFLIHAIQNSMAQSVCCAVNDGICASPGPWPKGLRTAVKNSFKILLSHSLMNSPFFLLRRLST